MRKSTLVVSGLVVALLGLLFTLQGVDVIKGGSMSGTTFWTVAGPIIIAAGLALAGLGVRRRGR